MSLNRMKRAAQRTIPDGFEALDFKRTLVRDRLAGTRVEHSSSDATPRSKDLRPIVARLRRDLWHYSLFLTRALKQGHTYADASGLADVKELCRREQTEIRAALAVISEIPRAPE
jgi:hypothetical protein